MILSLGLAALALQMSSAIRLTLLRDVNSQLQHLKLHAMSDMRNYSMMRQTGMRDAMLGIGMSVIRVALVLMSVMKVALTHVLMTCSCHRNGWC